MRAIHSVAVLILFIFAIPFCGAQASESMATTSPETVLRTTANMVLVDVVVEERDKPVHGLDRSRFHVFEDGHEQTIASFDEHRSPDAGPAGTMPALKHTALPAHTYTNIPEYPEASTVTVLLLDGLNTRLNDQMNVRNKMIAHLGKIKPGTSLAIFGLSSQLRMIAGFSTDMAALDKALKNPKANGERSTLLGASATDQQVDAATNLLTANATAATAASADAVAAGAMPGAVSGPMGAIAALRQFQADTASFETDQRVLITLDAPEQLARYLTAIPGRKSVIWFSSSFPFVINPDPSQYDAFSASRSYMDEVRQTTEILSDARVAIYPIDARGLMLPSQFNASVKVPASNTAYMKEPEETILEQDSMRQIAKDTGGKVYVDTNDFENDVADVVGNGASYYTLGYVPTNKKLDGEFHKFEVKADNASYKLAYRSGYYADAPEKPSAHHPGETSPIVAASWHGAPPASQITFVARVLPGSDPLLQGVKLTEGPMGDLASKLKGPKHRYVTDIVLDLHGLVFDTLADGSHQAHVEFAITVYDAEGTRVNYLEHAVQLALRPDRFEKLMASGVPIRAEIDLPEGQDSLRIAIHDLSAHRVGSLEIPVHVQK
jgi:VWFA-related protein